MWEPWEKYNEPLAPARVFWWRVVGRIALAVIPLTVSLAIGWLGYMVLAGLGPVDAFLNASMILGGMGPVDTLTNDPAKIFAGIYAIYSGVVFLVIAGLIISPFFHRIAHRLHIDTDDHSSSSSS